MKWMLLFLGLSCHAALAEPLRNSRFAVEATPAQGWEALPDDQDESLALRLVSPPRSGSHQNIWLVRVYANDLDFRGAWNELRRSVITELGGQLLRDEATKLGGYPARRLTYKAESPITHYVRVFTQTQAIVGGNLVVVHTVADPNEFEKAKPDFHAMTRSFRLSGGGNAYQPIWAPTSRAIGTVPFTSTGYPK